MGLTGYLWTAFSAAISGTACSFQVSLFLYSSLFDVDAYASAGYNTLDGLTGGFVFGANGSGLITPRMGLSPFQSGANTPSHGMSHSDLTQMSINAAFHSPDGISSKLEA